MKEKVEFIIEEYFQNSNEREKKEVIQKIVNLLIRKAFLGEKQ